MARIDPGKPVKEQNSHDQYRRKVGQYRAEKAAFGNEQYACQTVTMPVWVSVEHFFDQLK